MEGEDFRFLTEMSQALYSDKSVARARALEIMALLSVPQLSHRASSLPAALSKDLNRPFVEGENELVKAVKMLLYRAEKEGLSAVSSGLNHPFFRLTVYERAILMMLHSKRCSYKKCSQLIGLTSEEIEKVGWHARLKLSSQIEVRGETPHPPGAQKEKNACPEYFEDRPWTQRLLDDELKAVELTKIQNHLLVCVACSRSLQMTRKFYYAIEKWIPQSIVDSDQARDLKELRRIQIESGLIPKDITVTEGLKIFLSRAEVIVSLALLLGLLIFRIFYFNHF